MIGIYKITNPSGKVYIGQSNDIEKRFKQYKRLDCKGQPKLYNSFIKYGVDTHTFEIVMECNISDLNYYERHYQEYYYTIGGNGLNLKYVGLNDKKCVWSDELKIKQSNSTKKRFENPYERLKTSIGQKRRFENQEERKRVSEQHKGKKHSEEHTLKQSIAQKKRYENPEERLNTSIRSKEVMSNLEVRKKISDALKGVPKSKEHIEKLKKPKSESHKKSLSDSKMGVNNPMFGKIPLCSKKVINKENNVIYETAKYAYNSMEFNFGYVHFTQMLKGKKTNKTTFEYVDNL